jgi:hypothetical protein
MSIRLHPTQSKVYRDLFVEKSVRHAVVVASRGWGKSHMAAVSASTAAWELMTLRPSVPNKNVVINAPTYSQVTDVYYPLLMYQLGLERYAQSSSRDLGRIKLPNDVEIKLFSYEAVERQRGTGVYYAVNDEVSSWTKGAGHKDAWESIIEPCISTRWSPKRAKLYRAPSAGRSLTISTPKGYNYLYDMYHFEEVDPTFKSYHFDYTQSPLLDPEEIDKIRHRVDPVFFNREYLAKFEGSGKNVFYCFDRKIHVNKNIEPIHDGEDVHVAIDFNVGLQCSSVWTVRGKRADCHHEFKGHPDTETLGIAIKAKYKDKGHRVICYPDPSGNSRKTSAPVGVTDFSILRSMGFTVLARDAAPKIVDSVASVNKHFKTAAGEVNAYVNPQCQGVIESLEKTVWVDNNPDTATIDKSAGIEHYSDGIRYFFEYKFPVRSGGTTAKRGFGF